MQLENSFTVPAAPDAAWDILLDVPRIAPCMPGAELTETVGEHSYKGNATKGRGAASARVEFRLVADGAGSRVDITSDIDLTGSIAQYGRASGLIDAIAGQIIADFAENLAAEIGASDAPEAAPAESAPDDAAAPAPAAAPPSDNSISGIRLFFRALWSMIRGGRA
jgi:carbon monoxide dehydrogenase subunit G